MKKILTLCVSAAVLTVAGTAAVMSTPAAQKAEAPGDIAVQADGGKMYAFLPMQVNTNPRGLYSFSVAGTTPQFSLLGETAETGFTPAALWADGGGFRGFYYAEWEDPGYGKPSYATKYQLFTMTAKGVVTLGEVIDVTNHFYGPVSYNPKDKCLYGFGEVNNSGNLTYVKASVDNLNEMTAIKPLLALSSETQIIASAFNTKNDKFYTVARLNGVNYFFEFDSAGNRTGRYKFQTREAWVNSQTGLCYNPEEDCFYFIFRGFGSGYGTDGLWKFSGTDYKTRIVLDSYPAGCYYSNLVYSATEVVGSAAPNAVTGISWTAQQSSVTLECTLPKVATDGSELTKIDNLVVYRGGSTYQIGGTSENLVPGQKATVTINTNGIATGNTTFDVAVRANNLISANTSVTVWVGNDTPSAPTEVAYSNGKLTWKAPEKGIHGGYIQLPLSYNVYLGDNKVGTSDNTEYTFDLSNVTLGVYTASVQAVSGSLESAKGVSEEFVCGSAAQLPYELPLTTEAQTKLLSVFGEVSRPWQWKQSGTANYWQSDRAYAVGLDEWFALPPIEFSSELKTYVISYELYMGMTSDYSYDTAGNTIAVYAGSSADEKSMSQVLVAPETVKGINTWVTVTKEVKLPVDGVYYIGFRNQWVPNILRSNDCADVRIRNINIIGIGEDKTPRGVSNLKVVPAPEGKLTATVTFTYPTEYRLGTPMEADTEIEAIVTCGDFTTTVKGKPGEQGQVEIEVVDGTNTVSVVTKVGDVVSQQAVSVKAECGSVAPLAPTEFKVNVDNDRMGALLTWNASAGVGTGYVDPAKTVYEILLYDNSTSTMKKFTEVSGVTEYAFEVTDDVQKRYQFGIRAYNASGESDRVTADGVILGKAFDLTFSQNFTDVKQGTWSTELVQQYWGSVLEGDFKIPYKVDQLGSYPASAWFDYDDPNKMNKYAYIADVSLPAWGRLRMPYFSTVGHDKAHFKATVWNGNGAGVTYIRAIASDIDTPEIISQVSGSGWVELDFNIPEKFLGKTWVQIYFDTNFATAAISSHNYFALTNVVISDNPVKVEGVYAAQGLAVDGQSIVVTGHAGEQVSVVTLDGRTVALRTAAETEVVDVLPGVYVVRAGADSAKLVVK